MIDSISNVLPTQFLIINAQNHLEARNSDSYNDEIGVYYGIPLNQSTHTYTSNIIIECDKCRYKSDNKNYGAAAI